jgi:hypothetical protein
MIKKVCIIVRGETERGREGERRTIIDDDLGCVQ